MNFNNWCLKGMVLSYTVLIVIGSDNPLENVVDLTNDFSIRMAQALARPDVNIVFSPYGLVSVIVLIHEGSHSSSISSRQIENVLRLPRYRDLTQLGFRDLHRYLRSYFTSDGFLRGLVLSNPSAILKPNYLRTLKYYGFEPDMTEHMKTTTLKTPTTMHIKPTTSSTTTTLKTPFKNDTMVTPDYELSSRTKEVLPDKNVTFITPPQLNLTKPQLAVKPIMTPPQLTTKPKIKGTITPVNKLTLNSMTTKLQGTTIEDIKNEVPCPNEETICPVLDTTSPLPARINYETNVEVGTVGTFPYDTPPILFPFETTTTEQVTTETNNKGTESTPRDYEETTTPTTRKPTTSTSVIKKLTTHDINNNNNNNGLVTSLTTTTKILNSDTTLTTNDMLDTASSITSPKYTETTTEIMKTDTTEEQQTTLKNNSDKTQSETTNNEDYITTDRTIMTTSNLNNQMTNIDIVSRTMPHDYKIETTTNLPIENKTSNKSSEMTTSIMNTNDEAITTSTSNDVGLTEFVFNSTVPTITFDKDLDISTTTDYSLTTIYDDNNFIYETDYTIEDYKIEPKNDKATTFSTLVNELSKNGLTTTIKNDDLETTLAFRMLNTNSNIEKTTTPIESTTQMNPVTNKTMVDINQTLNEPNKTRESKSLNYNKNNLENDTVINYDIDQFINSLMDFNEDKTSSKNITTPVDVNVLTNLITTQPSSLLTSTTTSTTTLKPTTGSSDLTTLLNLSYINLTSSNNSVNISNSLENNFTRKNYNDSEDSLPNVSDYINQFSSRAFDKDDKPILVDDIDLDFSDDIQHLINISSKYTNYVDDEDVLPKNNSKNENQTTRRKRSILGNIRFANRLEGARYMNPANQWFNTFINRQLVPVLTVKAFLPYADIPSLNAQAIQIPLDVDYYTMLILLPKHRMGLKQLLMSLEWCSLRSIIASLRTTPIYAEIPTFTMVHHINLVDALVKLGIRDIFDPRKALLTEMSDDPNLYVRSIEQVVTISVREHYNNNNQHRWYNATESQIQKVFSAMHPFLFFVIDTETKVALVSGIMIDPSLSTTNRVKK